MTPERDDIIAAAERVREAFKAVDESHEAMRRANEVYRAEDARYMAAQKEFQMARDQLMALLTGRAAVADLPMFV